MLQKIKDFMIPHKGNGYLAEMFALEFVVVLVAVISLLQVMYIGQMTIKNNGKTLAAVLPGTLIDLANSDRSRQGILSLKSDSALSKIAKDKAEDMARRGYFSHKGPHGEQPWQWLDSAGYRYSYAGENLAVNFTESTDVESAWMNSPMHRKNILKPNYTHVGVGVADGVYKGKRVLFVVQFFATPVLAQSVKDVPVNTQKRLAVSHISEKEDNVILQKTKNKLKSRIIVPGDDTLTKEDEKDTINKEMVLGVNVATTSASMRIKEVLPKSQTSVEVQDIEKSLTFRQTINHILQKTKNVSGYRLWYMNVLVFFFLFIGLTFIITILERIHFRDVGGVTIAITLLFFIGTILYVNFHDLHTVVRLPLDAQYASTGSLF